MKYSLHFIDVKNLKKYKICLTQAPIVLKGKMFSDEKDAKFLPVIPKNDREEPLIREISRVIEQNKTPCSLLKKISRIGRFIEPENSFFVELEEYLSSQCSDQNEKLKNFSLINRIIIGIWPNDYHRLYFFLLFLKWIFSIFTSELQKIAVSVLQNKKEPLYSIEGIHMLFIEPEINSPSEEIVFPDRILKNTQFLLLFLKRFTKIGRAHV